MTLHLGWFSTGRGPGSYGMLQRVLQAIDAGELDVEIQFVFSNRERGEGEGSDRFFDLVESRGIPLANHSFRKFRRDHSGEFDAYRAAYEARVLELLNPYKPDLCVLAGYLLILGPALCRAYTYLNLHPALPDGPKGLWQSVIWELITRQADESGVMVFRVIEEVDEGPPVAFTQFSLRGLRFDALWAQAAGQNTAALQAAQGEDHPLVQAIRQEGLRREPPLLLETIKAFARGELRIQGGEVVGAQGGAISPRDLTEQVETALSTGGS